MPRYRFRRSFFEPMNLSALLGKIAQFTADETNHLISIFNSIDFLADQRKEQKKFSEGLAKKTSTISPQEADQLFNVIVDVLEDLSKTEFREDIVEDSLSLESFSEKDKEALFSLLRGIHKSTNFYDMTKIRSYKRTGPDVLQAFDWAVDFRGVFKKHYRYADEDIVNYEPKLEDIVPMVILQFVGSSPFNERTFQVDEEDLDKLINQLLAAQKQLIEMKKTWGGKNE